MHTFIHLLKPIILSGIAILFILFSGIHTQDCWGQTQKATDDAKKINKTQSEADKIINEILGLSPSKAAKDRRKKYKPRWNIGASINAGLGYENNVLLSPVEEKNSSFLNTGLNLYAFSPRKRINTGGFYALVENTHYFTLDEDDDEFTAYGILQWKNAFTPGWRIGIDTSYAYYQMYYDLSLYDLEQSSGLVEMHIVSLIPLLEWDFKPGWTAKCAIGGSQTRYEESNDDFDTIKYQGGLTRSYRGGTKLSLSYTLDEDDYDEKEQKDPQGITDTDTHLETTKHTLKLKWKFLPGRKSPWQFKTTIQWADKEDNGEGYYDYTFYSGEQSLRYRKSGWTIEAKIKLSEYDYDKRDVMGSDDYLDRGINLEDDFIPPAEAAMLNDIEKKNTRIINATCRLEKALSPSWVIYLEGEYEDHDSNEIINLDDDTYDYDSKSVSMGLLWKYASF